MSVPVLSVSVPVMTCVSFMSTCVLLAVLVVLARVVTVAVAWLGVGVHSGRPRRRRTERVGVRLPRSVAVLATLDLLVLHAIWCCGFDNSRQRNRQRRWWSWRHKRGSSSTNAGR